MKKVILGLAIIVVLAAGFGVASLAYAQNPAPQGQGIPGSGYGMMNRGGMMSGNTAGTQAGFLHDEMIAAWATRLNLTVDEINTRLANGETMSQIAYSKGISADQFRTLMAEVRSAALDQAVKEGTLTQAQADWMKTRGPAGAGRGMRGNGQFGNPSCPYYNQTNP